MIHISSLDEYSWNDIENLKEISVGDSKSVSFGRYGVQKVLVAGIDHFCRDSMTFISSASIIGSKMSDYAIVGGLKKADSLLETLGNISSTLSYELMSHLPRLDYGYKVDGRENHFLMNVTIPSLEDVLGENRLELFKDEENLKSDIGWWTSTYEKARFYSITPEGEKISSNPYDELGVRVMFTYVKENVDRVNYIGIGYPDTIGETNIADCVKFNSSMEGINRVYYPTMFNL